MSLKIRSKLILFSVFIIFITTMATLVGSIILSINQAKRQNLDTLQRALVNVRHRINANLVNFDESIGFYLKQKDMVHAGSLSVIEGKSYYLVSLAGTDFLSFAAKANLDAFALYSAPKFKGREKLRLYFAVKVPDFKTPTDESNLDLSKINLSKGLFIVENQENRHIFYQPGGVFSRIEIKDPKLFPLEYSPGRKYYLEKRGEKLILVSHYNFIVSGDSAVLNEGTHLGYLVLEKQLGVDLAAMSADLGVEPVVYTPDGKFGRGGIKMTDIDLEKTPYSDENLVSLSDRSGQRYDALIFPLIYQSHTYGYLSVSISQKGTEERVYEYVKLLVLIGIIVVLLVILISFGIVNRATKPIITLATASSAIAEGDLGYPIPVTGNDELTSLAKSFSRMRDAIREKIELSIEQNLSLEKNLKIIEQKNQELHELDQLKDEFLANTSHELRSPLHGIIGIAEAILLSDPDTPLKQEKDHLAMIISNGRRLNKLINDLLDFYKIREFGIQLQQEPIKLPSLVNAILAFCEPLAEGKTLVLKSDIPDDMPTVYADSSRLEQVFYNLIDNAIKFTDSGEILINTNKIDEQTIRVSVKDTGIGIPEDQQGIIFDIFTQGKSTVKNRRQGTGLGLSIAKSLLMLHGSDLLFESEEGKGTCFYFDLKIAPQPQTGTVANEEENLPGFPRIPLKDRFYSSAPIQTQAAKQIPADNRSKVGFKIMVIDDEPVNLETLNICLSTEGYNVILKSDGETALKEMAEYQPDLVLLDLMMPGINGYDVCRQIREKWDLVTLPVIILSAKSQLKDLERGFQAGANDYLIKPFQPKEIISRVHTQLLAKTAVEHLKANQLLQEEIAVREKIAEELRTTQDRMKGILDKEKDAIICFNKRDQVVFFNRGAEQMIGFKADEVLGRNKEIIFPPQDIFKAVQTQESCDEKELRNLLLKKSGGDIIEVTAYLSPNLSERDWLITVIVPDVSWFSAINSTKPTTESLLQTEMQSPSTHQISLSQLNQNFRQNRERITLLEEALSGVIGESAFSSEIQRKSNGLQDPLKAETLNHHSDQGTALFKKRNSEIKKNELKRAVVDVMNKAMECWETSAGKTKLDLAEESQIWHVNIEDICYKKTRTLDRYLNLKTLPKKPRIREVVRTANYVLEHTSSETHKIRLEAALLHLRSLQ